MSSGTSPYRLPDATRIGRVRLQVSDLGRSIDFYERILGLRTHQRLAREATLGAAGGDRPLVELRERRGARPIPRRGVLGLYHFALLLPERVALGRFAAHLGRERIAMGSADHAVSESLYLHDPDGLGIEVYVDRPRSTWQHRNGELFMTTGPLDWPGVLASADDAAWTEAPPGTTMGHVHLSVGDLQEASRFYHVALGFERTVWSYPGALFLSVGGYHHHLGLNTWSAGAPAAREEDARLIDWEVVVPTHADSERAAESIRRHGIRVDNADDAWVAADPWGITVRIRGERRWIS